MQGVTLVLVPYAWRGIENAHRTSNIYSIERVPPLFSLSCKPHSMSFDDAELKRISKELDKQLGPEFICTRPGQGGMKVSYLSGTTAISLANHIFGFNGWHSEVKSTTVDFVDTQHGKISMGLSSVIRVTLKDGSFHEDIGYGSVENAKSKAIAFEKCRKEAITDGLKRVLRCFGNALGNCLYDKEYLRKISNVKTQAITFNEGDLMRHNQLEARTLKQEAKLLEINQKKAKNSSKSRINVPPKHFGDNEDDDSHLFSDEINIDSEDFMNEIDDYEMDLLMQKNSQREIENVNDDEIENKGDAVDAVTKSNIENQFIAPNSPQIMDNMVLTPDKIPAKVEFVSAKVAEKVQNNSPLNVEEKFNPSFQSPSLRRTVDPTKSMPIRRTMVQTSVLSQSKQGPKRMIGIPPDTAKRHKLGSQNQNTANDKPEEKQLSRFNSTKAPGKENSPASN